MQGAWVWVSEVSYCVVQAWRTAVQASTLGRRIPVVCVLVCCELATFLRPLLPDTIPRLLAEIPVPEGRSQYCVEPTAAKCALKRCGADEAMRSGFKASRAKREPLELDLKYRKVRDINAGSFGFVQEAKDLQTGDITYSNLSALFQCCSSNLPAKSGCWHGTWHI